MKSIIRKTSLFIALISIVALGLSRPSAVHAVAGNDFNPGMIISDSVFYSSDTMSVEEIQVFLEDMVNSNGIPDGMPGECDSDGSELYGGITRAQYSINHPNGTPPPFVCLPDYYENTTTGENNYWAYVNGDFVNTGGVIPSGAISAAQIIANVAEYYDVNPRVLLVLLQKEQSLLTDDWPWGIQYQKATGYGCPDSAPCNSEYYGFYNQVRKAAYQFTRYRDLPGNYNHIAGQNNTILYNPNVACGSSSVFIENQATAGLYNYTPYQPNAAAIGNLYGTGDSCSSYGNRNFWRLFNDWFGSTIGYYSLIEPRWMEVATDTYKKYPATGENSDQVINTGEIYMFTTEIFTDGKLYLRTAQDTDDDVDLGILFEDLVEVPYEPFITPRYMQLNVATYKLRPSSGIVDYSQLLQVNDQIRLTSKIFIDGQWYFRSEEDQQNNINLAIPAVNVSEIEYVNFLNPRFLRINTDTHKRNPVTEAADVGSIAQDTQLFFNSKILVNGKWCYRTSEDTLAGTPLCVDSFETENLQYVPYEGGPRWLRLSTDSPLVSALTAVDLPGLPPLSAGTQHLIQDKININGQWYYRAAWDSVAGVAIGIASADFEEIPFISMQNPRIMKLVYSVPKINPKTGIWDDWILPKDMVLEFTTKIQINGKWYLRTKYDTTNNNDRGFLDQNVGELPPDKCPGC